MNSTLREEAALAVFGGTVLPENWETDSRLPRVLTLIQRKQLEARIYALEQASRASTHERDPQMWADNEVEKAEAELKKLKKNNA